MIGGAVGIGHNPGMKRGILGIDLRHHQTVRSIRKALECPQSLQLTQRMARAKRMATSFFRRKHQVHLERCLVGLFNGDVLAAEHHGFSCAPGAGQKLQPPTGKFRSSDASSSPVPRRRLPKMATVYFFIAIHILSLPGKIVLIDCSVVVGCTKRPARLHKPV